MTLRRIAKSYVLYGAGVALFTLSPAPLAAQGASILAVLHDASGNDAGTVRLWRTRTGIGGKVEVKGLKPGAHGMHVHMTGKCTGPDFGSAGGHLNLMGKKHGLDNPMGPHEGDLPALVVKSDGTASQRIQLKAQFADLLDNDRSAFVVHEAPDDQKTDPSGNSGARLLCGVFEPDA